MAKVTYTKAQRDRAKVDGKVLCTVDTPGYSFGGPCTIQEWKEIVAFIDGFLKLRSERMKAERESVATERLVEEETK